MAAFDPSSAFWNVLATWKAAPAIVEVNGNVTSYAELDVLAASWRQKLDSVTPAGRHPVVALEFSNSLDCIAAYLGALQGGFPVLIAESGTLSDSSRIIDIYKPSIIISSTEDKTDVRTLNFESSPSPNPHPDLCILLSTSGSTGDPKLVRLSKKNIDSNARSIAEYLELTNSDRAITTLPWHYSYGMSVLNSYLASGASIVLNPYSIVESEFRSLCDKTRPTSMALVPHQFELMDRLEVEDLPVRGMRYVTQAGGRLDPALIRKFSSLGNDEGWQLFIMYGQTEAAPRISYVPPNLLPEAAETIGRPIPGGSLHIIDDHGNRILDTNRPGELVYSGPNVMMGYAEKAEDLSRPAELSELRTGDIAEITDLGLFRIVGRLKRFVKLFGLRLSLDQIEALLRKNDISAHAISHNDALVLLCRDPLMTEKAIHIVSTSYGLPTSAVHAGHLSELPLLSNGKTDMQGLQRIAKSVLDAAQRNKGKEKKDLSQIMAAATRSQTVLPTDSFTSLGGDSLSYLEVQMALEDMMGKPPAHWENMSISQLNQAIKESVPAKKAYREVNIDVILRVLAISLVVAQHASDLPLYGGTWMLILLMGYSVGRFQFKQIAEGRALAIAIKMLYPILPLYFSILLVYELFRHDVPIEFYLLIGNYRIPSGSKFYEVYWFVSLYVQIVGFIILISLAPLLRNQLARKPWLSIVSAALASIAVLAIQTVVSASGNASQDSAFLIVKFPIDHPSTRGLIECLPIFFLGWILFLSGENIRRKPVAVAITVVTVALFYLNDSGLSSSPRMGPTLWIFLAALLLLTVKGFTMPERISKGLNYLAASSLFVYLTHQVAVHFFLYTEFGEPFSSTVKIPMSLLWSFAIATFIKMVFDYLDRKFIANRVVSLVAKRLRTRSDV